MSDTVQEKIFQNDIYQWIFANCKKMLWNVMNEKKCLASHFQLLDKSKYIMQFDMNMNIDMNEGNIRNITLEIS